MADSENENEQSWYGQKGPEQDVVASSKVRIARNLANFPFPLYFRNDDGQRVQTLIFDAFAQGQLENQMYSFHAIDTDQLDPDGRRILEERGVINAVNPDRRMPRETGVVMTLDGKSSAQINYGDHIRLSTFNSGLSVRECYHTVSTLDEMLQKRLQFAASYDFGYLTAALRDCGTGLEISARIHIPATVQNGKFGDVVQYLREYGYQIAPVFPELSDGMAAGSWYLVYTAAAMKGTELDQLAEFESALKFIAETERKISAVYADNKRTIIRNSVIRAYTMAKFSLLVSLKEAVSIISDIKFGKDHGFVTGIEDNALCGLLYRVQTGHLAYLLKNGTFSFEKDIAGDERTRIDCLRAMILQEAFEKISLEKL